MLYPDKHGHDGDDGYHGDRHRTRSRGGNYPHSSEKSTDRGRYPGPADEHHGSKERYPDRTNRHRYPTKKSYDRATEKYPPTEKHPPTGRYPPTEKYPSTTKYQYPNVEYPGDAK